MATLCVIRTAHAPSSPGLLDIAVRFFMLGLFLFEIVIVGCPLSENGTFGRPEAVLGYNGTGYQKTGLSLVRSPKIISDISNFFPCHGSLKRAGVSAGSPACQQRTSRRNADKESRESSLSTTNVNIPER
ncbi:hypothetical protein AVEN_62224-1 [Araneus ventricosus]|uniref:Uncharacterized protein n=1 Tax=Araneus ventricosus TaxID=182803 RepID=A0A4Y2TX96_ARAVE|nr:hypothetical protein AVEN_95814-1 [Araneus ventricosus]GBO03909.1 hypothetical protein AVEN_20956-1 [Araneus ventricosus]GBO03912.1 hypothetical protein AVEN_220848-1 [Araneus ventricosus]GBO03977.1 hypothetical protein AVEN_62224-1 [Araneus ventricosus]